MQFSGCSNDDDDGNANPTPTPSACAGTTSVFDIQLSASDCQVDIEAKLGTSSVYSENISGNIRTVTVNNVASHKVGAFPNSGNPNTISAVSETYQMTTLPAPSGSKTYAQGFTTGLLFSGVAVEPYTAEFFMGPSGPNMDWNITTLQSTSDLGLDYNNAHVQPNGRYHYHGTPSAYLADLGSSSDHMVKVGYAADGYPMYYKYGYASDGTTLKEFKSGWKLKTNERGGDGVIAPKGCPDGYYFQDYEFVGGTGLDECNGRTGQTPESESEYYYVITDNFPSMPICFMGIPDMSFHH